MSQLQLRKSLSAVTTILCSILLVAQPLVPSARARPEPFTERPAVQENGTAGRLPIVFVPGTAGSELRVTNSSMKIEDELYWMGRPTLKKNRIMLGALDECGHDIPGTKINAPSALTAVKVPILRKPETIYANFLAWAKAVFGPRFYEAPYDWRKGAGKESAELLDRVVDRALKESGQAKVIILAHSLGGLVSRDYISRMGKDKVAALIAVGTPWLGAPKTVRALLWGYNFGAGKNIGSKGHVIINGLPPTFHSSVCSGSRCQRLADISFLKMEDVRKLAKNFPAVYQQLPTTDFMQQYGLPDGKLFRSVVWDKDTAEEMQKFYRETNPCLSSETKAWRRDVLSGQDFGGVINYLIGGVYYPRCEFAKKKDKNELKDCRIDNRTDMQMPEEKQITKSTASKFISGLIHLLNIPLSIGKYSAHNDPFVALDSDYQWGDGTAPLLSATAGEYTRGDQKAPNVGTAVKFLGPRTKVQMLILGPKYGHSAMLDDPQVRTHILEIYETESGIMPKLPDIAGVDSLVIKISAEENGVTNRIHARLVGLNSELPADEILGPDQLIHFEQLEVLDSTLFLPKEKSDSRPVPLNRFLLTSEIPGMTLQLTNTTVPRSTRTLKINELDVMVNEVTRFRFTTPFELAPGTIHTIPLVTP